MGNFVRQLSAGILLAAGIVAAPAAAAVINTVQAPTGFFVPTDAQKFNAPYYRGANSDWGWTHGAIASGFTSATLNVSAFDVDFVSGETDNIYAYDDGVRTLLGTLTGSDGQWEFGNEFVLGANFFNDISAGLQVEIDIDATRAGWFVTLGKSVISTDGAVLPPPTPGVPEPSSWMMLIAGFGLVGAAARRRNAAVAA
jgi:hypothetical protein